MRSVSRFLFPKSPNATSVARKDLPVSQMGGTTALVNGEPVPLARMQSVLTPGGDMSAMADGRYRATQVSNEDPNFAARRRSEGADYRVLYLPEEDHGSYVVEGGRAVVRVTDVSMRPGAFTPLDRGGGRLESGYDSAAAPKTAQEYVAPERRAADLAMQLGTIAPDLSRVAMTSGLGLSGDYRRAKAKFNDRSGEVEGFVRPLGFVSPDLVSRQAAASALDRRSGEILVYFPEFGWGGFIPSASKP
jgi:hypothetical protein